MNKIKKLGKIKIFYEEKNEKYSIKYPEDYNTLIEMIQENCEINDINNYEIIEDKLKREVEDQHDFELMTEKYSEENSIQINVKRKNNNKNNIKNENKINEQIYKNGLFLKNKMEKNEEDKDKDMTIKPIPFEELEKQIKILDLEQLQKILDLVENSIQQKKINKIYTK